jgi:hypothetical protein
VQRLNKAEDLIAALSPTGQYADRERYLFRGHPDSSWELLPKALRTTPSPFSPVPTTPGEQLRAEIEVIVDFADICDRRGLPIPGDSPQLRAQLINLRPFLDGARTVLRPPDPLRQLFAVAQHYGSPTRFLDWSRYAYAAAYFAAAGDRSYLERPGDRSRERDLCVWVLDRHAASAVEVVDIAYATNPNAHAQEAAFTVDTHASADGASVDRTPLDQKLPAALTGLELPASERPSLLRLLDRNRVNGARLFPGLYGVSRAQQDLAYRRLHLGEGPLR